MKKNLHRRCLPLLWIVGYLVFSSQVFANQQAALDWLVTQQAVDGSYTATTSSLATPIQSVAEVIRALQETGQPASAYNTSLLYLNNDTELNTEYLARKIIVNTTAGNDVTTLINSLIARQNPDGGFGDQAGYASTVLDTSNLVSGAVLASDRNSSALNSFSVQVAVDVQNKAKSIKNGIVNDPTTIHTLVNNFSSVLEEIENYLNQSVKTTQKVQSFLASKPNSGLIKKLEELDGKIASDFNRIERQILDKKLPKVILERHKRAAKSYKNNLNTLQRYLKAFEQTDDIKKRKKIADDTKKFLSTKQKSRKHQRFTSQHLPGRTPSGGRRSGRTSNVVPIKSAFAKKPILLASKSLTPYLLSGLVLSALPTSDDLASTLEAPRTAEFIQLAQELGGNSVAIYEYVRNGFEFEPYAGSAKGANLTLKEKGGNDWDLASLLIALLRSADIPARYVVGNVDIPIDRAMSWVGIEDPQMAANLFSSIGRETRAIVSGGKIVAIRTQHVWVRAYVPFEHHRGAIAEPGDTWIDLDPSFKLHKIEQTLNPDNLPVFDQATYLSTFRQNGALDFYENQLQAFLDLNFPGYIPSALERRRTIQYEAFGVLPAQLPYTVQNIVTAYSSIPESEQQVFKIEIVDGLGTALMTYAAPVAKIADNRLTLSYIPASAADASTISAYGGILYDVPPYLLSLKPQIKLDGLVVAEGPPVPAANEQTLLFTFQSPDGTDFIENTIVAGEYHAIALAAQKGDGLHGEILDRADRLRGMQGTLDLSNLSTLDETLGELLYLAGRVFLQNVLVEDRKIERISNVLDVKGVSEVMYFLTTQVQYSFGIPRQWSFAGISADMDRSLHLVIPVDGNLARVKPFMELSGHANSFYEHKVTENFFGVEAVSAVKALQLASDQGIPVYTINQLNSGTVLSTLDISAAIKNDILNVINMGWEAVVPERPIVLGDWTGVGYILSNPVNAEGYYRISGGYGGAAIIASQDLKDRLDNITLPTYSSSAGAAAKRVKRRYPGADGIWGNSDDSLYTPYTEREAHELDGPCVPSIYKNATGNPCTNRYTTRRTSVTEAVLIDSQDGNFLTEHLEAAQWKSQEGAPFMRAGYTIIRVIGDLINGFGVINHGINGAGSGYRTVPHQRYNLGINTFGHHPDGTAADIVLSDKDSDVNNPNWQNPEKIDVLCIAHQLVGFGEVLDEGTAGSVHIAKPALRYFRDHTAKSYSWSCRGAGFRIVR